MKHPALPVFKWWVARFVERVDNAALLSARKRRFSIRPRLQDVFSAYLETRGLKWVSLCNPWASDNISSTCRLISMTTKSIRRVLPEIVDSIHIGKRIDVTDPVTRQPAPKHIPGVLKCMRS